MTPFAFMSGCASVNGVDRSGRVSYYIVDFTFNVRPVVSLKSNAISGGSGTMTDPFLVG